VSRAIKLDSFEWVVYADDDEPKVIVTLGSEDAAAEAHLWFELDAEGAQDMGSALIRAFGVIGRRVRLGEPNDDELYDDEPTDTGEGA